MDGLKERIVGELEIIGFAKATDYLSAQDNELAVLPTDQLPKDAGAAIASIERSSTGLKVKFYDKLKALELLGKCCGLFDSGAVQTPQNNLLEAILEATGKEMKLDAIPEAQSPAAADHDLVEQTRTEA